MTQQLLAPATPTVVPASAPTAPTLREATFEDYPQIARLEAANHLNSQSFEDWQRLWTKNPTWHALRRAWPLGWVLEDAHGQIVGALMNVPSTYWFKGQPIICGNGRGWVVQPKYRGYSLWLMDEYLSQPGAALFVATTVGQPALETWSTFGVKVPVGDWCAAAYWITSYRGFLRRALRAKKLPLVKTLACCGAAALKTRDLFKRKLPCPPTCLALEETYRFDERFDQLWRELLAKNPNLLLGVRDRATLQWHFATPLRHGKLWIFTASRDKKLCGYLILKRQEQANGMRRMRVIDFQSIDDSIDLLPPLLQAALHKCRTEKIDLLEHVGVGVPKMHALDDCAPYRRRMETWPFFFRAADTELHETLRNSWPWDPSIYDGDASFE